jgi:hypothetical protein
MLLGGNRDLLLNEMYVSISSSREVITFTVGDFDIVKYHLPKNILAPIK